ncbi:hypothetical protein ACIXNW_11810 [Bacteroides fragilis]
MIKEDTEKAANDFADREYEYDDIDRNALYKGFYWGAQWRINSVWHNSKTEVPDVNTIVLVEKKMVVFGSIKYLQKVKCWAGKDGLISKT